MADTIIGESTFGRMCRKIILVSVPPIERAANMNSRSLIANTSPLTIRAVGIQLVIPIETTIKINIPFSGPNDVLNGSLKRSIITKRSGRRGRDRNRSVNLIRALSSFLK